MAFKPETQQNTASFTPRDPSMKFPTPEGGNQPARISLIVDLGIQEREDFIDPNTKEAKPQKPVQQIAVFADLVDNVVDYGGEIGEKQYRLLLNKSFKGDISGINFTAVPPRDADGNLIEGRMWTFHPASLLTKLAKATGQTQILGGSEADNMDVEQLLNKGLMIDVEVKETVSDKKDKSGKPIVYTNVNPKVYATLPKVKGQPMEIEELMTPPLLISFENVTEETAKFIRADIRRKIMQATNYPGSRMQEIFGNAPEAPAKPAQQPQLPATPPADAAADDSFDDDVPF